MGSSNKQPISQNNTIDDVDIDSKITGCEKNSYLWLMGLGFDVQESDGSLPNQKKMKVVFVVGGPGSGKGTQCEKIVQHYGYTHLSTGDLLRKEIKTGSENGTMIQNIMKEGKLVPSDLTVGLIKKAISEIDNDKFLIDGFPRNEENLSVFENLTGIEPEFVLFLDCPKEEMTRRLLSRNRGRDDDNEETIRKRLQVFEDSTLPVINYYASKGKVRKPFSPQHNKQDHQTSDTYFKNNHPLPSEIQVLCCVDTYSVFIDRRKFAPYIC
ncbi:hypothetical protein M9H77_00061 [Catharanthus roseus]|nr:hypothetical protein M9H77_00061 [Catharanthus roseus]